MATRQCAGLTKSAFKSVNQWKSSKPFICNHCRLEAQANKLEELQTLVVSLQSQISDITQSERASNAVTPSMTTPTVSRSYSNVVQSNAPNIPPTKPPSTSERKFNIVIYGIKECTKGTRRHTRITKDLEAVIQVIQPLDPKISKQSIRDCSRLGKYNQGRNRPILVKLTCAHESASILGNRRKLADKPGISIKPDMTKEQRQVESLLLKERRALTEDGTDKSLIRIRGNALYVKSNLHGSVVNSKFVLHSNPQPVNSQPSSHELSPSHSPLGSTLNSSSLTTTTHPE